MIKTFISIISISLTSASISLATLSLDNPVFQTGSRFWTSNKLQSVFITTNDIKKHKEFTIGEIGIMLNETLEMHKNNIIRCPMVFKIKNYIDGDLELEFQITPFGAAELIMFTSFQHALVELIETEQQLVQNSKYCRQDLEKIKDFYLKSLFFITKAEDLYVSTLNNKKSTLEEKGFLKDLELRYTDAHLLNGKLDEMRNNYRRSSGGVLSVDQYIQFFAFKKYSENMNALVFVETHLRSKDQATRMLLSPKRKVKGNLADYDYDFLTANATFTDNSTAQMPPKKKKRNRRRKKKTAPVISTHQITEEKRITTEILTDDASSLKIEDKSAAIATKDLANDIPPLDTAPLASDVTTNTSQALVETQEKKEEEVPIPFKDDILEEENEVDQLHELDILLQKFDGGPKKGMKTRHFLRLCSTLNKMGYFSEFTSTRKEVKLKTNPTADGAPGMMSVMHTNHSNKKKDTGITRPTAQKLRDVIETLKQQQ